MSTQTKENNSSSSEELKQQASKIIAKMYGHTEKFVHQVIEEGSKLAGSAEEKIRETYDTIIKSLTLDEVDMNKMKIGDLIISLVDLTDEIKAGDIFEYTQELSQKIDKEIGLFYPSQKQLMDHGRSQELKSMLKGLEIMPEIEKSSFISGINKRIEQLRRRS